MIHFRFRAAVTTLMLVASIPYPACVLAATPQAKRAVIAAKAGGPDSKAKSAASPSRSRDEPRGDVSDAGDARTRPVALVGAEAQARQPVSPAGGPNAANPYAVSHANELNGHLDLGDWE